MPNVKVADDNGKHTIHFYGGIMPTCEGLSGDWNYTMIYQKDFCLDTSDTSVYHLLIKETKVHWN